MTEIDVEIKTEPVDDEHAVFKEEELIIKTEIDIEDTSCNLTPVPKSLYLPKKICINFQDDYTKGIPTRPMSPNTFQCHECRRFFVSESSLFNHKCLGEQTLKYKQDDNERKLLNTKRFQCYSCNQKFQSQKEMFHHNCKKPQQAKGDDKRLRGRTAYTCTICRQTFLTLFIFEEHMRHHRNKLKRSPIKARKPICIVPKSLLDPKVMVFACNLCDISFTTAKGLKSHNVVHREYEYICKKCGKSFKCAVNLKTHSKGDTCTIESVADLLGRVISESCVDIKAEVESEEGIPMESEKERCTSYSTANTADFVDTSINDTDLSPDRTLRKKNVTVQDNFAATVTQLPPTYTSQEQDMPLPAQRNAFRPTYTPQRLDVIIDGLGNAFVMKKEDLITGALEYPQIQTFQNEQVVVDAQGNAFKFRQKPAIGKGQLPLVQNPQQQDVFCISQDHCYTKSSSLVSDGKEETAELEIEPPSDPVNYKDLIVEESSELTIKEEPAVEIEPPSETVSYEDLLIEELFDRKAKFMAKQRKAAMDALEVEAPPKDGDHENKRQGDENIESVPFEDTAFDEARASNCLYDDLTATVKEEPSDNIVAEETSIDSAVEMDPQSVDDFEEMIDSTKAPHLLVKCEIMEDLRDEYQKAKNKKPSDSSADESSQQSSQEVPFSIFVTLTEPRKFYNNAFRKLDKRYRYIWICGKCPKQYIQRHSFYKHQLSAHYKDSAELKGEVFELRPELLTENIDVDGYCHLCHVTLADAVTLQKHKKDIHAEEENASKMQYRCYICGKFCSSRSTLGDHIHSDCGKNPQYGCEVCGKKFYSRSTLQLHKSMHTGELPFRCTYCDKRVRTRGQLTVHTRTHTGERPFPCKVCERRFTHRETLISHLSRHIDMKRYKCNGCQALFASISGLKTHRDNRIQTCGKFKFNSRPIGPRVRVIKGNVIFEPQPKFNPYSREYNNVDGNPQGNADPKEPDDNTKENANLLENINQVTKTKPNSEVKESITV